MYNTVNIAYTATKEGEVKVLVVYRRGGRVRRVVLERQGTMSDIINHLESSHNGNGQEPMHILAVIDYYSRFEVAQCAER